MLCVFCYRLVGRRCLFCLLGFRGCWVRFYVFGLDCSVCRLVKLGFNFIWFLGVLSCGSFGYRRRELGVRGYFWV